MGIDSERYIDKDQIRAGLVKYTERAFAVLPGMYNPRILDIGCGSGVSTMEFARLTDGEIIGLDIDDTALDRFKDKIQKAWLSHRVKAIKCSMFDMDFPDESFDIIWSEGSIYAIGFEKGLKEWRKLLKPNGFLVVHDQQGNIARKLEQIPDCGYHLLNYFTLSTETWWAEYFAPLEKRINEIKNKYSDDSEAMAALKDAQQELDIFRNDPLNNSSVCFVMQKR